MSPPSAHAPPWFRTAVGGAALFVFLYVLLRTTAAAQPPPGVPTFLREFTASGGLASVASGLFWSAIVGGLSASLVLWIYVHARRLTSHGHG